MSEKLTITWSELSSAQIEALISEQVFQQTILWLDTGLEHKAPYVWDTTAVGYMDDIAAAWRIVERITRPPESLLESVRAVNTRFALWFDSTHLWSHSSQEAAEAICKAALIASEVVVE